MIQQFSSLTTEQKKLVFYVIVGIGLILLDLFTKFKECFETNKLAILLIIVHVAVIEFIFIGWIFNNIYVLILYLLSVLGIQIYWAFNGACDLTIIENKVCGFESNTTANYASRVFDKKTAKIINDVFMIIATIIVIVKLFLYLREYKKHMCSDLPISQKIQINDSSKQQPSSAHDFDPFDIYF